MIEFNTLSFTFPPSSGDPIHEMRQKISFHEKKIRSIDVALKGFKMGIEVAFHMDHQWIDLDVKVDDTRREAEVIVRLRIRDINRDSSSLFEGTIKALVIADLE